MFPNFKTQRFGKICGTNDKVFSSTENYLRGFNNFDLLDSIKALETRINKCVEVAGY